MFFYDNIFVVAVLKTVGAFQHKAFAAYRGMCLTLHFLYVLCSFVGSAKGLFLFFQKAGEFILPNAKVLEEKKAQVAALKEKFAGAVAGVIVDYKGTTVEDDTKLRKELREAGVEYSVAKNTLIRLAIDGTALAAMDDILNGTTAVATSSADYVAAAKILSKFAESHENFTIKSGLQSFPPRNSSLHRLLLHSRLPWHRSQERSKLSSTKKARARLLPQQKKPQRNNSRRCALN